MLPFSNSTARSRVISDARRAVPACTSDKSAAASSRHLSASANIFSNASTPDLHGFREPYGAQQSDATAFLRARAAILVTLLFIVIAFQGAKPPGHFTASA
jgi:hypothetical protein